MAVTLLERVGTNRETFSQQIDHFTYLISYYIKHRSHVLVLGPPSVDFNQTWDLCWGPQVVLVLFWGQPCPEGLGPRGGPTKFATKGEQ